MFFNFKGESFSDLRTVFAFASLVPQLEGGFSHAGHLTIRFEEPFPFKR